MHAYSSERIYKADKQSQTSTLLDIVFSPFLLAEDSKVSYSFLEPLEVYGYVP